MSVLMALHILLPPLSFLPSLLSVATLEAKASFKSPTQAACSLAKIKLHIKDIKSHGYPQGNLFWGLGFFVCTFNDIED